MNLLPSHYFILIPSVLAIIMVSRVHPFPYSETKSWIHQQLEDGQQLDHKQQNHLSSQQNKASSSSRRSSFGGECPDCLSQEKASLRLLHHPTTTRKEIMMPADEATATAAESPLHSSFNSSSSSSSIISVSFNNDNRSSLATSRGRIIRRRRRSSRRKYYDDENDNMLASSSSPFSEDLTTKVVSRGVRDTGMSTPLTPCLAERQERLRLAQSTRATEYIPNCRKDGSYAHVQCHPSTRSCWCVTRNGRPFPGSSVLSVDSNGPMQRPNCAKYNRRAKSQTRRRSSQMRKDRKCTRVLGSSSCVDRNLNLLDDVVDHDAQGGDEDSSSDSDDLDDDSDDDDIEYSDLSCNQADWSRFTVALLKTFRSEYNRYRSLTSITSVETESASDTVVLAWKFDHVDRNKDMILQRNETNILKNLVKQQIQPRSCAKNFIASCSNGDQQITKTEWLDCLRVSSDVNLPFDTFNSLVDSSTSRGMHPSLLLKPVSSSNSGSGSGSFELTPPLLSSGTVGETTEQSNCWTDRQSALASQKQNESIIIPECTANGNYRKVQCAQVLLTGKAYCWCVEEESGVQIPNTVVFNTTPDCNNRYSKPMKGCSGTKKHKFLMDLFSTLKSRMAEATRDGSRRGQGDISRNMSPEEQASRWYFSELDVNSNSVLDRKEWKTFRNETSMDKRLKKCGKKLPRHCDVNQDKKITMTEWLDCLGVKFLGRVPAQPSVKRPVNRSHGPRTGKNPFTTILKQRR